MKLRVKRDQMAYLNERRYREGQVVEVSEKLLKKADEAYAKKHGVKVGSLILPLWAESVSKPIAPEPTVPGTKSNSGSVIPREEGDEGEEAGAAGGDGAQNVL